MGVMQTVHLRLDAITLSQQGLIARRQIRHEGVKATPEFCTANPGAWQHLLLDELVQGGGDLEAMNLGACSHVGTNWKVERTVRAGFALTARGQATPA